MKRTVPQIQKLAEESVALYDVLNEESDIACVLISASYLDSELASLLKHFFIEGDTAASLLEPPKGFLSSFASRYELAYSLGLIPKGLFRNLKTVGGIRNIFAHSHFLKTLSEPALAGLVAELTLQTIDHPITIDGDEVRHNDPPEWAIPADPRTKFTLVVVQMVNFLLLRGLSTKRLERRSAKW